MSISTGSPLNVPSQITPSGATSASVTTGGAVNLDNSGATGAGLVLYSNQGASATGRLLVVNQANIANPQQAVRIQNRGSGHTVTIFHDPSPGTTGSEAVDVVSTNRSDTCFGIQGVETGRGSLKVTHDHPAGATANDDANAACLRVNWADTAANGTAVQGLFMDSDNAIVTTGKLIDIRNAGPNAQKLSLTSAGLLFVGPAGGTGAVGVGGAVGFSVALSNVVTAPTSATANGGVLYSEAGTLKWMGTSGVARTVAAA